MDRLGLHAGGGSGIGHSEGGTGGHAGGAIGQPRLALFVTTVAEGIVFVSGGETTVLRASAPCASDALFTEVVIAEAGSEDCVSTGFTVIFASTPFINFLNSGGNVGVAVCWLPPVAVLPPIEGDATIASIILCISGGTVFVFAIAPPLVVVLVLSNPSYPRPLKSSAGNIYKKIPTAAIPIQIRIGDMSTTIWEV